jgi:hypothetical protein
MRFAETTGSSWSLTPSRSATSLGEVGLEADDGTGGVTEAERLVVGLSADHEDAALPDLVERLCRERSD